MNSETAKRIVRSQLPGYKLAAESRRSADSGVVATADISSPPLEVLKQRYLGGVQVKLPPPATPSSDSGMIKVVPKRSGSSPAQPKMIVVSKGRIIGGQG